jgi:hypothetical protein
MEYNGTVDEKYIYATVVNKCKKGVVVRVTAQWDDGPKCIDQNCEKTIEPWFDEYTFYEKVGPKARTARPPLADLFVSDTQELGKPVFWTKVDDPRDPQGWTKQEQLDVKFGERYAFEVGKDCLTLTPRAPNQRLHKCYQWLYSAACGVEKKTAHEPSAEQLVPCGDGSTLTVEGDPANPVCIFETENGFCRIAAGAMKDNCPRR